jgi:hypothetical protein
MARPRKAAMPQAPQVETPAEPREPKNPSKIDYRSAQHRKPMTGLTQRLHFETPKGFRSRWFNDSPGRIQRAIEAGWRFAVKDNNGVIREEDEREGAVFVEHADTNARGESVRAYVMLIPEEFYKQDFDAKQAQLDVQMDAIKNGANSKMNRGDNSYLPDIQNKMP